MPRKAPGPNNGVTEHRITLGDFERKELKDMINSYQQDKVLENIPNIMIGSAGLVVAGTVACVGYALYYWLDSVPNPIEAVKEAVGYAPDKVRATFGKIKANQYSQYKTIEEVNAAWDEVVADKQQLIQKAAGIIAAYEAGKLGNFAPDWLINVNRKIVANEAQTMANVATERAEFIEEWTAYWADRNAREE